MLYIEENSSKMLNCYGKIIEISEKRDCKLFFRKYDIQ